MRRGGEDKMKKIMAIVLAGGRGQRMGVLCQDRSKPLLPFGQGKVIDFTLSNCLNSSVENISVAVDYQKRITADYVKAWGVEHGKHEIAIWEPSTAGYTGTADAIYQNLDHVRKSAPDEVIILAGDHIYQADYRDILDYHSYYKADVSIFTRPVPIEQASRFGVVKLNGHNRIIDFVEKPAIPSGNMVSMGVYVFKTTVLLEYLERDRSMETSSHDFGNDILPKVIKDKRVLSYLYDGYWRDIGTVEAYFSANMDYLHNRLPVDAAKWPIMTCGTSFRQLRASNDGKIRNSLVSAGSAIDGRVTNSIIWDNVHIGRNAAVSNSLVLTNTRIGDYSMVDHCVVDEDVVVDKVCRIGKAGWGNQQITVLGKGARVSQCDAVSMNYEKSKYLDVGYYTKPVPAVEMVTAR
jgi:glucose-1-phosphate adenylyltransferase